MDIGALVKKSMNIISETFAVIMNDVTAHIQRVSIRDSVVGADVVIDHAIAGGHGRHLRGVPMVDLIIASTRRSRVRIP